jgi:hypothetical protein
MEPKLEGIGRERANLSAGTRGKSGRQRLALPSSGHWACPHVDPGKGDKANVHLNDWAPVHESIAGPVIFAMRRMSGTHQFYIET